MFLDYSWYNLCKLGSIKIFNMKKLILSSIFAATALVSCSTVSSIMQNTFPYNTNYIIAEKSSANTSLTTVGLGNSINQITGATNNVKNIRITNATAAITSNQQSIGIFKSIKVYISAGSGKQILVASRDNISDNIGNSLALDIDNSVILDDVMKSGAVQQKIVYELKSSPVSDVNLRTSLQFSSEPIAAQ